jgi:hypothetical protein
MAKYIQGADGKLQGSIGDGKANVPTSPKAPPVDPLAGPRTAMLDAAKVAGNANLLSKSIAAWQDAQSVARDARLAYWSAKLDLDAEDINAALARREQPPLTDEERALIVRTARHLLASATNSDVTAARADLAYARARLVVLSGADGRLQQRGWLARRVVRKAQMQLHRYETAQPPLPRTTKGRTSAMRCGPSSLRCRFSYGRCPPTTRRGSAPSSAGRVRRQPPEPAP